MPAVLPHGLLDHWGRKTLPGDTPRGEEREEKDASVPSVREALRPLAPAMGHRQGGRVHPGPGSSREDLRDRGWNPDACRLSAPNIPGPGDHTDGPRHVLALLAGELQGSSPAGKVGEREAPRSCKRGP